MFAAARISARQFLVGPRKWVILLAGAAFPALLSLFVFVQKEAMIHPFLQLFDQLYLQGIILFLALIGATPAFSSDVEDATIIYLFARPTPRPLIVIGKWAGVMLPLVILSLIPVLVAWPLGLRQVGTYKARAWVKDRSSGEPTSEKRPVAGEQPHGGGTSVEKRPVNSGGNSAGGHYVEVEERSQRHETSGRDVAFALGATALGIVEYGTIFFVLGVLFARPYILSICYAVIFEVFIGRASVNLWVVSKLIRGATLRLMDPVPRFFEGSLETAPSLLVGWLGLVCVPVVFLAAASLVAMKKSYVSKGTG